MGWGGVGCEMPAEVPAVRVKAGAQVRGGDGAVGATGQRSASEGETSSGASVDRGQEGGRPGGDPALAARSGETSAGEEAPSPCGRKTERGVLGPWTERSPSHVCRAVQ